MNEKIEILGVKINNETAQDSISKVLEFLGTDSLSTVGVISSNVLVEALKEPGWSEKVESLDLTIIGDKEVLKASGKNSLLTQEDVVENRILKGIFDYAIENHRNVALLAENESDKIPFQKYMKKQYRGLEMIEVFSLDDATEDEDSVVNLLNAAAEDIIVAAIPSPQQEEFLAASKQKLGAKVWIGLGQSVSMMEGGESKVGFLGKLIEKRLFKRKVSKYQSEKGE